MPLLDSYLIAKCYTYFLSHKFQTMTQAPSPALLSHSSDAAQRATHELIETAQALITQGSPSLSPAAFRQWLNSPDEYALFPEGDVR